MVDRSRDHPNHFGLNPAELRLVRPGLEVLELDYEPYETVRKRILGVATTLLADYALEEHKALQDRELPIQIRFELEYLDIVRRSLENLRYGTMLSWEDTVTADNALSDIAHIYRDGP